MGPIRDCSLPTPHTTAQDKRMGPHDRAKLQAKLDLAKAKVLRRTPKDPGNFAWPRIAGKP